MRSLLDSADQQKEVRVLSFSAMCETTDNFLYEGEVMEHLEGRWDQDIFG